MEVGEGVWGENANSAGDGWKVLSSNIERGLLVGDRKAVKRPSRENLREWSKRKGICLDELEDGDGRNALSRERGGEGKTRVKVADRPP